jgi:hypothetical protein
MSMYELTPQELYETYTEGVDPQRLIDLGRDKIATQLMVEEQLDEEEAYYAADQILVYAQQESPDIPMP